MDKMVKGATKVKLAAPKPKYIEPILQSTYRAVGGRADGDFEQVMRCLATRLKDGAWTVVYKALIVLHLMMREGAVDVTLDYLSRHSRMLEIKIGPAGNAQAVGLPRYAKYLHTRASQFKRIQVDYVRIPLADSASSTRSRSGRNGSGGSGGGSGSGRFEYDSRGSGSGQMGRLRELSVEKGLLRECDSLIAQVEALLKCRFHEEDVSNDITLMVFRLLVHDLLSLYQALNEGVINVLEHYFEMSKYDAEHALAVYAGFAKQTSRVVAYLKVAKNLEHMTKLHVPNIKHAPTSLMQSLEEYLHDPDFEINHRQYLAEKQAKAGKSGATSGLRSTTSTTTTPARNDVPTERPSLPNRETSITNPHERDPNANGVLDAQPIPDFYSMFDQGIEQKSIFDQPTGVNTNTGTGVSQSYNPWMATSSNADANSVGLISVPTGQPQLQPQQQPQQQQQFAQQPTMGGPLLGQLTGPTQNTGMAMGGQMTGTSPFGGQPTQPSAFNGMTSSMTGFTGQNAVMQQPLQQRPLSAAMTGSSNPFRQSMLYQETDAEPRNPFAQRSTTLPVVAETAPLARTSTGFGFGGYGGSGSVSSMSSMPSSMPSSMQSMQSMASGQSLGNSFTGNTATINTNTNNQVMNPVGGNFSTNNNTMMTGYNNSNNGGVGAAAMTGNNNNNMMPMMNYSTGFSNGPANGNGFANSFSNGVANSNNNGASQLQRSATNPFARRAMSVTPSPMPTTKTGTSSVGSNPFRQSMFGNGMFNNGMTQHHMQGM